MTGKRHPRLASLWMIGNAWKGRANPFGPAWPAIEEKGVVGAKDLRGRAGQMSGEALRRAWLLHCSI